ncbi:MAG: cytochrome c [Alphaproteobacteria bacterium]|nr:cytochrome c [Alphaproteobacteria bacterium]
MVRSVLTGTAIAAVIIIGFLTVGCATFLGPRVCARDGRLAAMTMRSAERHDAYTRHGLPFAYKGRRNPLLPTIGNLVDGANLYDERCALCHGMMGVGDGEAGEKLEVPPADLSRSLGEPIYRDDFFYWSIAEGGNQFRTDMPTFKNNLKPTEIWKILTFMRAAFAESNTPAAKDAKAPP